MYTFEEIIGNEWIIKQIQYAIEKKHISHAYVIQGQQGMGKKLLANTIAKTLQCQRGGITPCNECISCRTFDTKNHTDVFYVSPQKKKVLGVEDVREQIIENMQIKQYQSPFKIFIVEKADTMTQAAQNALLKTLEEPPDYGILLLLTSNMDALLPTILSRCVVWKLRPLSAHAVEGYLLQKHMAQKEEAAVFAEYAQGSIGKAIEIASSEVFSAMREDVTAKICSLQQKNLSDVLFMAKELEVYKENQQFLDLIYLWYRDVLAYKKCNDIKYIIQKDKKHHIMQQAKQEQEDAIAEKINAVWQAKQQLAVNGNFQLTMEVMLMKLKESSSNDRNCRDTF